MIKRQKICDIKECRGCEYSKQSKDDVKISLESIIASFVIGYGLLYFILSITQGI